MAVSSSSDFTLSTRKLIERSLRMVGSLQSGASADETKMKDALMVLNAVSRELDLERLGLWVLKTGSFTTTASLATYTSVQSIPTDILRIETATFTRSSGDELRIEVIGFKEYDKITDKTISGDPRKILISEETDLSARSIKLWPVPSAAKTVSLRYRRRAFDFDSGNDTPDYPAEWFNFLSFRLAAEIADEYNVEKDKVERLFAISDRKLERLKAKSVKGVDNSRDKATEYY